MSVSGCLAFSHNAASSGPPDATLYTSYNISSDHTSIGWIVCGSTAQSSGCYSSGTLGPFGKVGAILEGNSFTNVNTNTVTRSIYVLDIAGGTDLNVLVLHVYKKTDTISPTYDTVDVTPSKTVNLSLAGGSSALASMAANAKFLFIGTNQSPYALEVQKSNFNITQIPGFSPPINVSAITANKYGYVTVTFGSFSPGSETGFVVLGPDGRDQADGGGASFMLNTVQAVLPSAFQ